MVMAKDNGSAAANNSGTWETVGKASKKSSSNKAKKVTASTANSKTQKPLPKVEEVLPIKQVASWYANIYDTPPEEETPPSSPSKKANKAPPAAQTKKPKKGNLEKKKPAKIEDAVANVSSGELKNLLAGVKTQFPDNQLLWLRDAASYLNLALATSEQSPSWTNDPFSDRPLSLITKETKKALIQTLEQCSETCRQTAYETFLVNVAHDMAKGLSVNGYLVFLQLFAEVYPSLSLCNMTRYAEVRNSYQNRPSVCTALLWALGQGGRKDLSVGLKVWLEFMVPLLTLRHYSKFVVDYLKGLLFHHPKPKRRILYPSHFFQFFESIFVLGGTNSSLHKDLTTQLSKLYGEIKELSIGDCSHDHELFPEFLRRLSASHRELSASEKREILNCLQECLVNNCQASISHWQQMYTSYIPTSCILLQHLVENWKTVGKFLGKEPTFEALIEAFQVHNQSLNPNKDGVAQSTRTCEKILSKMTSETSSSFWFPWKTASLVLLIGIFSLIDQDIQTHGSYRASNTGMFMQDIGLYDPSVRAFRASMRSYKKGQTWVDENLPGYVNATMAYVGPYVDMASKATSDAYKYALDTAPIVTDKVNEYFPGIKGKVSYAYEEFLSVMGKTVNWCAMNGPIYSDYFIKSFQSGTRTCKLAVQNIVDGKTDVSASVIESAQNAFKTGTTYFKNAFDVLTQQLAALTK